MPELMPVSQVNAAFRANRIKAVVVDDSAKYLETLLSLLECEGLVNVVRAGMSGVEAICAVADLDPDLLLMDVNMHPMSGIAAAMVISAMYPRTKVILMSAEDCLQIRKECLACGAHSFVSKMNFMDDFSSAIHLLGLSGDPGIADEKHC